MKRIPVLIGLLSLLTLGVFAQNVSYVGMTFNLSFPTGDTKSFVNEDSYLGFAFEARRVIRPGISAGLSLSWTAFEQKVAIEGLEAKDFTVSYWVLGIGLIWTGG